MKKLIGAAMAAGATMAGVGMAHAEVTANIALTSDYVFRGLSLSAEDPAVQGGFDWSNDQFYAGVWASSLDPAVNGSEFDLYAGWTPSTGPVTWDIGLVGYFYPGAQDDGAEFDYFEGLVSGALNVTEQWSAGAGVWYSPENFGDTGDALYYEINSAYQVNDMFAVSGAFGNQSIDDVYGGGVGIDDDYSTWNIGATAALHGFEVDLRYHEADVDADDPIADAGYTSEAAAEGRAVLTISREL